MEKYKNVAVFATGSILPYSTRASGLKSYIKTLKEHPEIKTRIAVIVSDHAGGNVSKIAQENYIPFLYIPRNSKNAGLACRIMMQTHNIDLAVLCGYMSMVHGIDSDKMLNIHPGKLPDTAGLCGIDVHRKVIELRDIYYENLENKDDYSFLTAVTIHHPLPDVYDTTNETSVIHEVLMPVYLQDTAQKLETEIKEIEHIIYPIIIEEVLKRQSN